MDALSRLEANSDDKITFQVDVPGLTIPQEIFRRALYTEATDFELIIETEEPLVPFI